MNNKNEKRGVAAAMQNPQDGGAKNAKGGVPVAPKAAEYRRERREMAVGALRPAPWNPRDGITPESVADLAASIASIGLIQPLVAMEDGTLVCGHRRLAAAKAAGLETVPVDVLVGVDETTARRMTFIENLQRRDADPLLESELVNGLVGGGMTREEIAAETGRGARWVARRLNLANLSESWRERVAGGEEITVDCLEHVAAYPREIQEKLKGVASWNHSQPLRWNNVRDSFGDETCDLKEAIFDRKPCRSCQRNTGCVPDLFDWEGRVAVFGKCMDEKCFRRQTDLAIEKAKEKAKKNGLGVCERKEHPGYGVGLQDRRDSEHSTLYIWEDCYSGGKRMRWGRAPVAKAAEEVAGTTGADRDGKEKRRQKIAEGKARRKLAAWCEGNLAGAIARRYVVLDVPMAWAFRAVFSIGDGWRILGSRTVESDAALAHLLEPGAVDMAPANWPELVAPEIAKKILRPEIGNIYAERLMAILPETADVLTEEERRLIVSDEKLAKLRKPVRVKWEESGTDEEARDAALTGEGDLKGTRK